MQLARHAAPLLLLRGERAAGARAPLGLQALEHRVEGVGQGGGVRVGADELDPAARLQRVDLDHEPPQLVERAEHPLEQQQVQEKRRRDRGDEDQQLRDDDGRADRRGADGEHREDAQQHRCVRQEDAPPKRSPGPHGTHAVVSTRRRRAGDAGAPTVPGACAAPPHAFGSLASCGGAGGDGGGAHPASVVRWPRDRHGVGSSFWRSRPATTLPRGTLPRARKP